LATASALLTGAVVVATTVVGSSLFGLLGSQHTTHDWKLGLAITSALAAVIVAVQRTLGFHEQAERNRATGAKWQRVLNKATVALTYSDGDPRLDKAIEELEAMIDEVVAGSPQISEHYFKKKGIDLQEVYDAFKQHVTGYAQSQ
jgi:hypothetical protein